MPTNCSDNTDAGPALVSSVCRMLSSRTDVRDFEIRETTQWSVVVIIKMDSHEDRSDRILYSIQREPTLDNGKDLHWTFLGFVTAKDML